MTDETTLAPRPAWTIMLGGIFFRPRYTLQAVADHHGRGWWIPLLIMLVLTITMAVVSGPITARITREQISKMPGSEGPASEQLKQTLDFATSPIFTTILPAASGAIGLLIGWLVQVGFIYLAVTVLGGRTPFGTLWGITLWSAMPLALRALVQTIYIAATNNLITTAGLSGLVAKPTSDPLLALKMPPAQIALSAALGQIDLFVIWNLVLLSIGVAVAARFSHRKAALVVLAFWLISVVLTVVLAVGSASLASGSLG